MNLGTGKGNEKRGMPVTRMPDRKMGTPLAGEHGGTDERSGSNTGDAFCQGVTSGTLETDR